VGPVRRRSRPARTPQTLVSASLALLALACGGGSPARPDPEPAPATAPAPGSPTRVLLFPLNVAVALPTEVEAGVGPVSSELRAYLEGCGLAVETIELGAARDAWLRAAVAHKGEVGPEKMSFEGAASTLARQLRETRTFDALLVPWIAMRAARMRGGSVSWDGVKRKLDLAGDTGNRGIRWALNRLQLYVKAPSLQVAGFSPQGDKLFEGIGGLDLVDEAELDVSAAKIHFDMTPKAEILQDRKHLREGIAIALAPYLLACEEKVD
jgi:hypothetical protein